jgi:4-oxalocrotonate tautomerase
VFFSLWGRFTEWKLRMDRLAQVSSRKEFFMPFIHVRITRDGATQEQKAAVVREITGTLERVLGKRPDQTHIVIDEVDPDNWGFSGMLATEYRKRDGASKSSLQTGK